MDFKITEQYLKSKSSDESKCEDRTFISENFVAVINGATSKSRLEFSSKSIGQMAGKIIMKALSLLPYDANAQNAIKSLTKSVFDFYKKHDLVERMKSNPVDRLSASVAIFSVFRKEVWMVGDCQVMNNGVVYTNEKKVDVLLSEIRSICIKASIYEGNTIGKLLKKDIGREAIMPLLTRQSYFQNQNFNHPYSYAVIDGFPPDSSEIKIIKEIGNELILASDGYPKLFSTLKDSEKYLQSIIENDPLCFHLHKSTKGLQKNQVSFDDRAFVKIEIPQLASSSIINSTSIGLKCR